MPPRRLATSHGCHNLGSGNRRFAGTNRRCRHLTVGDVCWGCRVFLASLTAFIVVIVSHAALYIWALSYMPLTRDFRECVKSANGAEPASLAELRDIQRDASRFVAH